MNINEAFPSNYLKAIDLQGREANVIISNVTMEKLGNDTKMILYFQGKQKGMVCNKTNATNISMLYGDDTDGWIGKPVVLFGAYVDFQGKSVLGLRIKPPSMQQQAARTQAPLPPPVQQAPAQPARADLDDQIPF